MLNSSKTGTKKIYAKKNNQKRAKHTKLQQCKCETEGIKWTLVEKNQTKNVRKKWSEIN